MTGREEVMALAIRSARLLDSEAGELRQEALRAGLVTGPGGQGDHLDLVVRAGEIVKSNLA